MATGELAEYILAKDIQQSTPGVGRVCPVNPEHGRMTVLGTGKALVCNNRIGQDEAKRLHENDKPIAQLEGCKKFVCAHVEPLSVG